ncbi:MAG: hypothetical protein GX257_08865 [Clostridiales bacterium]|jgi:hypothetical protein|nr:hypothetical protein [Clostridiales bacterium]
MKNKPHFKIELKPFWADGTVKYMDISCSVGKPEIKAGQAIVSYCRNVVSIPFCKIDGDIISFWDDQGEIPAESHYAGVLSSFMEMVEWRAKRDTAGDIRYSYRVFPRELPKDYRSSPYFDFRAEEGGANGAGITFLAVPPQQEYCISLKWDLTSMPEGSRGVWSLGTGDVSIEETPNLMQFSYYAVGRMKSVEDGDFGIYWFSEPPFDMDKASNRIRDLYNYIAEFFEDEESVYRVFVRRDPFEKSGGGTALRRSFMFGYSAKVFPTVEDLQNMLAHEIVHNWPHIDDEPAGVATWFNEGTAEYYSVVLPHRAGITSLEQVLEQIEGRAAKYYGNALRALSNMELAKIYWEDRRAQVVPYGRGFFYLANTDSEIRRVSDGKRSLDDVVLELVRRRRRGEKLTSETWLELLEKELGYSPREKYDQMTEGTLIVPDDEAFGGAFEIEDDEVIPEGASDPMPTYKWRIK